jgi:hypothetical protein
MLVVHTYNPRHLGGLDQEDHDSRPARTKKFMRSHLKGKKLGHALVIPVTPRSLK